MILPFLFQMLIVMTNPWKIFPTLDTNFCFLIMLIYVSLKFIYVVDFKSSFMGTIRTLIMIKMILQIMQIIRFWQNKNL